MRPARQVGRVIYRSASNLYSPFIYDCTLRHRVKASDGALPMGDHVGVYVMAPFHGVWPSHLSALNWMVQAGVTPVVVSNLPLSDKERTAIAENCAVLIERPNQGYDFGAYREACLYLEDRLKGLSRLTFLNDSTWFPACGSQDWFHEIRQAGADFTGATSNFGGSTQVPQSLRPEPWSYGPGSPDFHMQSYALSFGPSILKDSRFIQFWRDFALVNDKDLTVQRGEIGLSRWLISQGWSTSSTYPIGQMDSLLAPLPTDRLHEIAENVIVLGNPRFLALKHAVLSSRPDHGDLFQFLLAAARCLGVGYALPDFNLKEMRLPFLKKSPVWHQREASDITLHIIREHYADCNIMEEARILRQNLLQP